MTHASDHKKTQEEGRMHVIALGVYSIVDRFPLHEEAFAHRLKTSATSLIEDLALFNTARTRDAVGTNRLLHQILGRLEVLRALLLFVKGRGLTVSLTTDIVLWHVSQLTQELKEEDDRLEQHIAIAHPQGSFAFGKTEEPASSQQELQSTTRFDAIEHTQEQEPAYTPPPVVNPSSVRFDPRIRVDAEAAFASPVASPAAYVASTSLSNGRQKRILDFFAFRRRAQLKDVISLFPDISEKTVRNDLGVLCKSGQLRRVGLAPRSHYILTA